MLRLSIITNPLKKHTKHKCPSSSLFYLHKNTKQKQSSLTALSSAISPPHMTCSRSHIQYELIVQSINSFLSLYCSLKKQTKSIENKWPLLLAIPAHCVQAPEAFAERYVQYNFVPIFFPKHVL